MALLRRFVRDRSQEAFATLARRRIDLVYSAALRQVRDPAMAEDIAQAVFITLARKAGALVDRDIILSAWLLRATHLGALDALRKERRRRKHEQQAATMNANRQADRDPDPAEWNDVGSMLDSALMRLREGDRRAIVLRFFEGRSTREIGLLQGISEEAARQRVWRAMERLRANLGARRATPSATALAGILTAHAVHAAPANLADAAARAALAAGAAKAAIPVGLKGAIQLMAWTKAQTAAAIAVGAMLIGGTTATVIYVNHPSGRQIVLNPSTPLPSTNAPAAPTLTPLSADAKKRFDQAYALESGQTLKLVTPPYLPERNAYLQSLDNLHMFNVNGTDNLFAFSWEGQEAAFRSWSARAPKLGAVIHDLLGVPTYKLDIRPEDANRILVGDWVFRPGATVEQKFQDLSRILAEQEHVYLRFEKRQGMRPVLVASGPFTYTPIDPKSPDAAKELAHDRLVLFYLGKTLRPPYTNLGIGDRNGLIQAIGETLGREVIYESSDGNASKTSPLPPYYTWSNHLPGKLTEGQMLEAAGNIGRQLDLTFTPDQRNVSYWSATPISDSASNR